MKRVPADTYVERMLNWLTMAIGGACAKWWLMPDAPDKTRAIAIHLLLWLAVSPLFCVLPEAVQAVKTWWRRGRAG